MEPSHVFLLSFTPVLKARNLWDFFVADLLQVHGISTLNMNLNCLCADPGLELGSPGYEVRQLITTSTAQPMSLLVFLLFVSF